MIKSHDKVITFHLLSKFTVFQHLLKFVSKQAVSSIIITVLVRSLYATRTGHRSEGAKLGGNWYWSVRSARMIMSSVVSWSLWWYREHLLCSSSAAFSMPQTLEVASKSLIGDSQRKNEKHSMQLLNMQSTVSTTKFNTRYSLLKMHIWSSQLHACC